MTIRYVRSTSAGANNGTSWTNAFTTLTAALAVAAPGDTIYVSQNHNEGGTNANVTLTSAGTPASPVKIICALDIAQPPTSLQTTGKLTYTGASSLTVNGSLYCYGVQFLIGSASSTVALTFGGNATACLQHFDTCVIKQGSTSAAAQGIKFGAPGSNATLRKIIFENTNITLSGTGNVIRACSANFEWRGGAITAGSATPSSNLFSTVGTVAGFQGDMLIKGVDFSALGSGLALFNGNGAGNGTLTNCRMPSGWSGQIVSSSIAAPMTRFMLTNCDSANTNYKMRIEDFAGTILQETNMVRTNGATDGVTPLSWLLAASSNANFPANPLITPEILIWNSSVGGSRTATIEFIHDSGTPLKDSEIWVELQYLSSSSTPISSFVKDAVSAIATPANQDTSTATWASGLGAPNKQKLVVTFTPQKVGFLQARIFLAKANYQLWVDPLITVT